MKKQRFWTTDERPQSRRRFLVRSAREIQFSITALVGCYRRMRCGENLEMT